MSCMFFECEALTSLDVSSFDTSNVKDMMFMFIDCPELSTSIRLSGNIEAYDDAFHHAATASDARIYVLYDGDCSRNLAEEIIGTKGENSHVYLWDAAKVTGLGLSNVSAGIKLSWDKQAADGYQIYRKASGETSYTRIKTTSSTSYMDESALSGKKYSYKVRSYIKFGNQKKYGSYSAVKSLCRLETVKLSSVSNQKSGIKLSWKAASDADGYYIYRKTASGSYKKIATIYSASTKTYTDQDVENGTKYTYAVAVFKDKSSSAKSSAKIIYFLKTPVINDIESSSKGKLKLSWGKRENITGVEIEVSETKDFSKGITTKKVSADKKSTTVSSLKSGKTYYARIRSYKKVNDKTYYSVYCTVKSIKVK